MLSDEGPGSAMYREEILEHYKNPQNFGRLDPHTLEHHGENPLCGDTLEITLTIEGDEVTGARFEGQGCAISQASTDILLGRIEDRPVEEVLEMDDDAMIELLGIDVPPLRVKCALLPLVTVQDGIQIHRGEMEPVDVTKTEG